MDIFQEFGNDVRFILVEVFIDGLGGEYNLQDDSVLRDSYILGWQVQPPDLLFGIAALGSAPTSPYSSRPLALTPAIYNGYLTVKCGSDNITESYPLISGMPTQSEPDNFAKFRFSKISPSKCFITIANPAANAVDGSVILLGFYYRDED